MSLNVRFLDWSLQRKFAFLVSSLLVVVFTTLGWFVYDHQRQALISHADESMEHELAGLYDLLDLQVMEKQRAVDNALRVAHDLFYAPGQFVAVDSVRHAVTAIHQLNHASQTVDLSEWQHGGASLLTDHALVDKIKELTQSTATVFQKIPDGYLRVSTNVMKEDGSRAVGTFIPNGSPVVQAVERGETFRGRAFVVNDWYATAYEPIRIDGQVAGILYVGVQEKDLAFLRKKFNDRQILTSGSALVLNQDGEQVIGQEVLEPDFVAAIFEDRNGTAETEILGTPTKVYFRFFEPYQYTLAIEVPISELYLDELRALQLILGGSFISGLLLLTLSVNWLVKRHVINPVAHLQDVIGELTRGKAAKQLKVDRQDEIGHITRSINVLSAGFDRYTHFAEQIGAGQYDATFETLSDDDQLGRTLTQTRDRLRETAEEERRRQWHTQGLARFADILRTDADDLATLSRRLLRELVSYVDANQGAVFVLNEEGETPELRLTACFAYQRDKHAEAAVLPGEGLVGQTYLEKETTYLEEVPTHYVRITSGLGDAPPRSLLLVPLRRDETVEGIIELASFRTFEPYQIEFIEKISESVAATVASTRVAEHTRRLLEASQQQEEELRAQEEEMRQNNEELAATQEEMQRHQHELVALKENLEAEVARQTEALQHSHEAAVQRQLRSAAHVAAYVLEQHGGVRIDDVSAAMSVTNQETQDTSTVSLPTWYVGERPLAEDHAAVDRVLQITGSLATIFQRMPNGFLRVSTNVMKQDGSRAVGTFIPNHSPVVQAVERGEVFEGHAFVVDGDYLTRYEPLLESDKLIGMLFVGVRAEEANGSAVPVSAVTTA